MVSDAEVDLEDVRLMAEEEADKLVKLRAEVCNLRDETAVMEEELEKASTANDVKRRTLEVSPAFELPGMPPLINAI